MYFMTIETDLLFVSQMPVEQKNIQFWAFCSILVSVLFQLCINTFQPVSVLGSREQQQSNNVSGFSTKNIQSLRGKMPREAT